MWEFKGTQRAELWRRRRGGSGRLQSGPRYLRQRVLAGSCLLMACMRRTDATNLLLGRQETTAQMSSSVHPRLLQPTAQAAIAGFLCVYQGSQRWKIFPWLGNSRLSHINSLMANRSSAHSAAFPMGIALAGSVPSPHFPPLPTPWHC